jgi:hypothetical protein
MHPDDRKHPPEIQPLVDKERDRQIAIICERGFREFDNFLALNAYKPPTPCYPSIEKSIAFAQFLLQKKVS